MGRSLLNGLLPVINGLNKTMLFFDSHIHIGEFPAKMSQETEKLLAYRCYSKNSADICIKKALTHSIIRAVVFPFPIMEVPFSRQNDYVINASRRYPYFYIPFLLPEDTDSLRKREHEFVGIKDHFYFDFHEQVKRPELFEYLQEVGKYYIFHAHFKKWNERISFLTKNFPKLKVIIAHSGRPAPFHGIDMKSRIDDFKSIIPRNLRNNYYFETSTIRDSRALEDLVASFGAEQVLFGSDYPYYAEEGEDVFAIEQRIVMQSKIGDEDKLKICSLNFKRLFQGDKIWIRRATADDSTALLNMLKDVSPLEQKYLALSLKLPLIRSQMKAGKHIFVAETPSGEVVGFLRESDRHNDTIMIEEVYVVPKARGKKVASLLVASACGAHKCALVKTYSENLGMNTVLTRLAFTPIYSPKGTMISWNKS